MLHKWCIDIMLKGRHAELKCVFKSSYRSSFEVAKEILSVRPQDFVSLYSLDMERNVLVRAEAIEYLEIYPYEEENDVNCKTL